MRLEGKTAIVTGGGGGIGRGIVRAFAREGARVCVVDMTEEIARKGVDDAGGGPHFPLGGDLTAEDDAGRVVRTALERMDHVDILVNCHGRASRELAGRPALADPCGCPRPRFRGIQGRASGSS